MMSQGTYSDTRLQTNNRIKDLDYPLVILK